VSGRLPEPTDAPLAVPAPGLARRSICALSGRAATDACPRLATEWLPAGDLPPCRWHRHERGRMVVDWPPVYRAWARGRGLISPASVSTALMPASAASKASGRSPAATSHATLRIVNPPSGGTYLRDPTLPSAFQTLPLRAIGDGAARRLTWTVDGRTVGSGTLDAAVDWPLAPGAHTIAVSDDRGRTHEAAITVK
jgi:membrane carboxypeptidase/penicillin-binding protein PbpC